MTGLATILTTLTVDPHRADTQIRSTPLPTCPIIHSANPGFNERADWARAIGDSRIFAPTDETAVEKSVTYLRELYGCNATNLNMAASYRYKISQFLRHALLTLMYCNRIGQFIFASTVTAATPKRRGASPPAWRSPMEHAPSRGGWFSCAAMLKC